MTAPRTVTLACSPDADDLFMMRALLDRLIDTGRYRFAIDTEPTDALNRIASSGEGPDVVALSTAHYPTVSRHYRLLPHGGSMGEGYGPIVVTRAETSLEALRGARIGVPGLTTTAWRVLQMVIEATPVVVPISPYARIFDALRSGEVDAGLIIHEGRLTYEDEGFVAVLDLGVWWSESTGGLPLPLGANALRRDLPEQEAIEISDLLRQSIRHALDHRDDAVRWLLDRGGALRTPERVERYLDMYANERTYAYGDAGRQGIRELLLRLGHTEPVDFAL